MKLFKFLALSAFLISQPVFAQDSSDEIQTSLEEGSCHKDHCKHHGHHRHHSHHRAFGANINASLVPPAGSIFLNAGDVFPQVNALLTTPPNAVVVWDSANDYFILNKKGLYLINFNVSLASSQAFASYLTLNGNPIDSSRSTSYNGISVQSPTGDLRSFTVLVDNQEAVGAVLRLIIGSGTVLSVTNSAILPSASAFNFNIVYLGETEHDHSSSSFVL